MDTESLHRLLLRFSLSSYPKMLLILVSLISISTIVYSQASGAATSVTGALCQIYNTVRNVIFLIGITLAVLGGVIYAVASIMPGNAVIAAATSQLATFSPFQRKVSPIRSTK